MLDGPQGATSRIWSRLEERFIAAPVREGDRLTLWRERVLLALCLIAVAFGPLALIPSLALAYYEGLWSVIVMDLAAYGVAVAILLARRQPLAFRAGAACLLLFALGTGLLLAVGPLGAGYIWLFGASVMAGALIGLRAAVASLVINILILLFVAALIATGSVSWAQDVVNPLQKWLVTTSNFVLINALVSITTALVLDGLRDALAGEQRVSASLARSEARFRALAENAPDVIFTVDPRGRFGYVNPALLAVLGREAASVLGQPLSELAGPGGSEALRDVHRQVIEEGRTVQGLELSLDHSDGRRVHLVLSASPRRGPDGAPGGMVGLIKDVTEQRMLTRQLLHAQKMEAIGTLAGGIAHDFNNLLAAILGYAELALEDSHQGRPAAAEIEQVIQASRRGSDLVRRILTFSRKVEPSLGPLDLNQRVASVVRMLSRTIPKMVRIETRLDPELGPVQGDAVQIEQVMINLANNAADAMPGGGRLLIVTGPAELSQEFCRLHQGAQPGRYALLEVNDQGEGIAPKDLEHIFEPFYTSKGVGKGTGLGLAMVFGIVKGHDGYIACRSRPGQGTTFDVYLPLAREGAAAEAAEAPEIPEPQGPGRGTVLVVDDEPGLLGMAESMLTRNGYQALTAASGEDALALLADGAGDGVDLVLLDLNMPGMGGRRCLEELLRLRPGLPVVITSGQAVDSAQNLLDQGASGYLEKPYTRRRLLAAVGRILAGPGEGGGPAQPVGC